MKCKKCRGKVFIDRVFSEKGHVELFCILCGKRWMLDKRKSKLASWLETKEREFESATSLASSPSGAESSALSSSI